jgi:hypothetical protein
MRRIHGYHYRSGAQTVQHSYIDGFLQVIVNNIMVHHTSLFGGPKYVLPRLLHNLAVAFLLTEAHSSYDDVAQHLSRNLLRQHQT